MKPKYSIFLLFPLILLLLFLPSPAHAAETESGTCGEVYWKYTDGTLYIYGEGAMEDYMSVLDRPWIHLSDKVYTIHFEEGVTNVGDNSFFKFSSLTTIQLPDSLERIGVAAFSGCENLTWILNSDLEQALPNAVQDIDIGAFAWCTSLTSLDLGYGVQSIGPSAFTECYNLAQITMSPKLSIIYNSAFYKCTGLTEIWFPDSVSYIGEWAFYDCLMLHDIHFSGDAPDIYENAFEGVTATVSHPKSWSTGKCQNYGGQLIWQAMPAHYIAAGTCGESVSWGLDENGQLTIYGAGPMYNYDTVNYPPWYSLKNQIKSVAVSQGVTTIGSTSFYKCTEIEEFSIPDSVTSFGDSSFFDCDSITVMEISANVTDIGEFAFLNCDNLLYFQVDKNNPSYANDDQGCLYNKDMTLLICVPCTFSGDLQISYGVTEIGIFAANKCSGIVSVALPATLKTIGNSSFMFCRGLESVEIPASVELIDHAAFWYCNNLTEISFFGDAPTFIENEIFIMVNATVTYPAGNPTWTEAVRQNYGGNLTWVPYEDPKFDIDVARMILGNSLEFQFGVAKTKIPDTTGYYAEIEKTWADGSTTTLTIPASDWGATGQYWVISYDGLAAKEMSDSFYVTIYNADAVAVSNAKTDSVRDYVARAFANQTAAGKTMMVDMLNYGTAAQISFNYNTTDPANGQLTDAQKAWGTAVAATVKNNQAIGPCFKGTRLVLESRIQMQVAFKDMDRTMYAVYTYTDHNGKQQSITVSGQNFVNTGTLYGIELSNLVYADARQVVTIKVYNADGSLHGSARDSIESYVKRSGADEPLFDALIKFTDSAKIYLH